MRYPKIDDLTDRHEVTGTGAYDYEYRYGVGRARNRCYAYIAAYPWRGNEGGYDAVFPFLCLEDLYMISADQMANLIKIIDRARMTNKTLYDVVVADAILDAVAG